MGGVRVAVAAAAALCSLVVAPGTVRSFLPPPSSLERSRRNLLLPPPPLPRSVTTVFDRAKKDDGDRDPSSPSTGAIRSIATVGEAGHRRDDGVATDGGEEDEDRGDRGAMATENEEEEVLSCRVLGFYPFPGPPPEGANYWLRDVHQAILVESTSPSRSSRPSSARRRRRRRVLLDFMTEDGEFHPVWRDETVKWSVLLGNSIRGEVRIRHPGRKDGDDDHEENDGDGDDGEHHPGGKMEQFLEIARSYDCDMNLYTNNCRTFCARMEREVCRLNDSDFGAAAPMVLTSPKPSELRFAARVALATLLPALYPLGAIGLLYYGCYQP